MSEVLTQLFSLPVDVFPVRSYAKEKIVPESSECDVMKIKQNGIGDREEQAAGPVLLDREGTQGKRIK